MTLDLPRILLVVLYSYLEVVHSIIFEVKKVDLASCTNLLTWCLAMFKISLWTWRQETSHCLCSASLSLCIMRLRWNCCTMGKEAAWKSYSISLVHACSKLNEGTSSAACSKLNEGTSSAAEHWAEVVDWTAGLHWRHWGWWQPDFSTQPWLLHWPGQGKLIDNTVVIEGQCVVYRCGLDSMVNWTMQNPVEDVTMLMGCNGLRKAKSFHQVQQFGCVCVWGLVKLKTEVAHDEQTSLQGIAKHKIWKLLQKLCVSKLVKTVTSLKYLGSVITDEGSKPNILSWIAQTTAALTRLKPVWNDRSISFSSKIRLMCSLVTSIFLYACESWTLTVEFQRRIQAMEMRCYRKILHSSYKDHVTTRQSVPRPSRQSDHTKISWRS